MKAAMGWLRDAFGGIGLTAGHLLVSGLAARAADAAGQGGAVLPQEPIPVMLMVVAFWGVPGTLTGQALAWLTALKRAERRDDPLRLTLFVAGAAAVWCALLYFGGQAFG